jgi:hypothetical protein
LRRGFPRLPLFFDSELFLFPAVFGGLLLRRLVGKNLFGDRDGLGLAQCLQGPVLVIARVGGGLGDGERRPAYAYTTGQNTQIAFPHGDFLTDTTVEINSN